MIKTTSIATLILLALAPGQLSGNDQDRPNVVFILSDDHRFDHLGCAGHPILKTPNIDRLAQEGVRFENAFVTTPICAASRATFLTGLYERTHKYTFGSPPITEAHASESYPSLLRRSGYQTGFVGKFGVQVGGQARGEMFDFFRPVNRSPYFKPQPDGSQRHATQITGDRAIEFLAAQSAEQPFCLSVSFNAPHAEDGDKQHQFPWPKVVDGMYDDVQIDRMGPEAIEPHPHFLQVSLNRQRWFWRWDTPEKYERNVKAYYRMISGVDHVVGRILDQLRKQGLQDNTVVIFCGDNGYYLGARDFAGKWSHYDESLRIPFIVFDPGLASERRGAVDSHPVLNVDLAPTVLDLAGIESPTSYQGRSVNELVQGTDPAQWREDFFCEHLMHMPIGIPKWEGVRGEDWTYARYLEQDPVHEFLHDLSKDPLQQVNLVHDPGSVAQLEAMRHRNQQLRDAVGGEFSAEGFPSRSRQPATATLQVRDDRPPNVVLIISDDHHWVDYSFMGHSVVRTPHLDRLANQSALFPRGYVPSSLCRPSLATMITGLYPHQHGITGNDPSVPAGTSQPIRQDAAYLERCESLVSKIDSLETIPKMLEEKGYVSFQAGKWWEGSFQRAGFTRGMTHGDPARGGRHGDEGLTIGRQGLQPIFDFIEAAEDKPFFVWHAPFMPHTPHNPPAEILARYENADRPPALSKYYAMCEWFDQSCGELLGFLDQRNLRSNTLVVYVADNGWIQRTANSSVPDNWTHQFLPRTKQSPYEGGVRTPIMLRWPGRIVPGIRDVVVSSIDLAPTILAAADLAPRSDLPGLSLLPAANAEPLNRSQIFGEVFAHDVVDLDDPSASLLYRWCIGDRWKLIVTYPGQTGRYGRLHPQTKAPVELYNLISDPHENHNVAEAHPEIVDRLSKAIDGWGGK